MNKTEAINIIKAYNELLARAIDITNDVPYYASVDSDSNASISIEDDKVVLRWKNYESDYYGGGSLVDESTNFPLDVLFLTDAELETMRTKIKKDVAEKEAKVRAAQKAVEKDRAEARDKAEWARLKNKFGGA